MGIAKDRVFATNINPRLRHCPYNEAHLPLQASGGKSGLSHPTSRKIQLLYGKYRMPITQHLEPVSVNRSNSAAHSPLHEGEG